MIALVQRVSEARVSVDDDVTGAIGSGLLILLGIHRTDTEAEARWLAGKCAALRIFPDEAGQMNRSVVDMGGEALVVSQFTLYGNASRGNRPSFVEAARPETAEPLYRLFIGELESRMGRKVPSGRFGAAMGVALVNDGPVTISLERRSATNADPSAT